MWNINLLCKLIISICQLPCIFSVVKSVPSTIERVNSETSNSVISVKFAMCDFANKCFPIELVSFTDKWRRTWWKTICLIPVLPFSSILQFKQTCHDIAYLESFQAIGCFEPTFIDPNQESNRICEVRSLKSQIKTPSFLEDIIPSINEVFKYFTYDVAVGLSKLGNWTCETVIINIIVKLEAGSEISTLELPARKRSDLWDIAYIYVKWNTKTDWKDWPVVTQFRYNAMHFVAV